MLIYLQSLGVNPSSIHELADDQLRFMCELGPSEGELRDAPLVSDWKLIRSRSRRLTGALEDGVKLDENRSLVWTLDLNAGWVRTSERFYRLGASDFKNIYDLRPRNVTEFQKHYYIRF